MADQADDPNAIWRPDYDGPPPVSATRASSTPVGSADAVDPATAATDSGDESGSLLSGRSDPADPFSPDFDPARRVASVGTRRAVTVGDVDASAPSRPASIAVGGANRSEVGAGAGSGPTSGQQLLGEGIELVGPEVDHRAGRAVGQPGATRPRRVWLAVPVVLLALVVAGMLLLGRRGDSSTRTDGPRLPTSLVERWSTDVPEGRALVQPLVVDDVVVVWFGPQGGRGNGDVVGYDVSSGEELWRVDLSGEFPRVLAGADGQVLVRVDAVFAGAAETTSFDLRTGEETWSQPEVEVLLSLPSNELGVARIGDFVDAGTSIQVIDLVTGRVVSDIAGQTIGLDSAGTLYVAQGDTVGAVRTADVDRALLDEDPGYLIEVEELAVVDGVADAVVEIDGRVVASRRGELVELTPEGSRELGIRDDRSEDDRALPLSSVVGRSFIVSVDEMHAVLLDLDRAHGVRLEGDELVVTWSATSVIGLPFAIDGDRSAVRVTASGSGVDVDRLDDLELRDAATGEVLVVYEGLPFGFDDDPPVNGVVAGTGEVTADAPAAQPLVGIGLDGDELWRLDGLWAPPAVGDRVIAAVEADDADPDLPGRIVVYSE